MDGKKIVEYIPLSVMLETPDLWEFYAENITRMLRALREAGCDPVSLSISTEDSIAPLEKRVSIVCTRMKQRKLPPPTEEEKEEEAIAARGIFTALRDERGIRIR